MAQFTINENSAFNFGGRNIKELRIECKDSRGLFRKLSSASYDNHSFRSLAEIFGVSIEAMAFRLEELELVKF